MKKLIDFCGVQATPRSLNEVKLVYEANKDWSLSLTEIIEKATSKEYGNTSSALVIFALRSIQVLPTEFFSICLNNGNMYWAEWVLFWYDIEPSAIMRIVLEVLSSDADDEMVDTMARFVVNYVVRDYQGSWLMYLHLILDKNCTRLLDACTEKLGELAELTPKQSLGCLLRAKTMTKATMVHSKLCHPDIEEKIKIAIREGQRAHSSMFVWALEGQSDAELIHCLKQRQNVMSLEWFNKVCEHFPGIRSFLPFPRC